jgi:hypothetical protein
MTEAEFHEFHTFVQACFDQGRQRFHPELRRITTDKTGYSPEHEAYLKTTTALAVTMEGRGDYQKAVDIWVNSSYYRNGPRFRATLAHERVHGYAGLKYGHNAHWRRWFYRVLWHLQKADLLGLDDLASFTCGVELTYNHVSWTSGNLLLCEAAEKAEAEHSQVLENYWKRIMDAPSHSSI